MPWMSQPVYNSQLSTAIYSHQSIPNSLQHKPAEAAALEKAVGCSVQTSNKWKHRAAIIEPLQYKNTLAITMQRSVVKMFCFLWKLVFARLDPNRAQLSSLGKNFYPGYESPLPQHLPH
ncbi:hypothetical protein HID58_072015 [Brassica napus]|uniref:Uncharacterized protein n=2 Tax=Brassica TaxID=3705 RepID=A0ABQ7Z392_BRANA|nr:hypothetical protein HID58_072015 [Brassica napus]